MNALKNTTGIGKNSKVFSIFDKYGRHIKSSNETKTTRKYIWLSFIILCKEIEDKDPEKY